MIDKEKGKGSSTSQASDEIIYKIDVPANRSTYFSSALSSVFSSASIPTLDSASPAYFNIDMICYASKVFRELY